MFYGVRKYNFHIIHTRNDLFNDLSRGIMKSVYWAEYNKRWRFYYNIVSNLLYWYVSINL